MLKQILALTVCLAAAEAGTDFRKDRVALNGTWKFQLRHDNQLTGSGPVKFGPVSASSQALMLEPWQGQTSAGRWRTGVPWPVSSTILGSEPAGIAPSQLWKPHPKQEGPAWWQAELERSGPVAAVRIHWVKPGVVSVRAELGEDGKSWQQWASAAANPEEPETWIKGTPQRARFVKLTFTPAQFDGTRAIDVFSQAPDGRLAAWQPRIEKIWYEALRRYTPLDGFHQPGFADAAWNDIQTPGYWEVRKFSEPTWWQPDDTVGYYRRSFSVPESWRGRQVRLRFEGVNNSAQVWINGQEAGFHESGFTQFEFDVTPYVRFGAENLIALRVAKWTLTHDYDTDDMWFLGGIWRDTYLYSLPAHRIDNFTLRTDLDAQYRDAVLRAKVVLRGSGAYQLEGELVDDKGQAAAVEGLNASGTLAARDGQTVELAGRVRNPRKWTAETPNLYTLTLRLRVGGAVLHEVKSTLGFRQVEVKGAKLLLNGVPLKLHGVVSVRANPNDAGEEWAKIFEREIKVLKESNINAIRSHTTPLEEDFLDLCDRHGIYILPDVPMVWVNEWDFRYLTDGAVLRAKDIYEQHKNRASVIVWHIGNENGPSSAYRPMGQAAIWLARHDPTRPVTICRNPADMVEFATSINDLHYYPMREKQFLEPTAAPLLFGEFHALPEEVERLKDRGFVETWGRSLKLEWAEFEKRDWLLGGLICCWEDGSVNGNIGPRQWGVVDIKRQPKDVWYHIRKVFAPVTLAWDGKEVIVANKYSFTDLEGFEFRWEMRAGGKIAGSGKESLRVKPGQNGRFAVAAAGDLLRVSVLDREGYEIQSETMPLAPGARATGGAELLTRMGVKPLDGRPAYRVEWKPETGLEIRGGKGEEWFAIRGLELSRGVSRKENAAFGEIQYGEAQTQPGAVTVPFRVLRGAADVEGRLLFAYGANWIRARYELQAPKDVTIRELGLSLRLPDAGVKLRWERASLWSSAPEGWLDGPKETATLEALAPTKSRRDLYWVAWEWARQGLLVTPEGGSFHLRTVPGRPEIVLGSYLDSGDFLGKFDRETVEKTLKAGQTEAGGLTVWLTAPAQWTKLDR